MNKETLIVIALILVFVARVFFKSIVEDFIKENRNRINKLEKIELKVENISTSIENINKKLEDNKDSFKGILVAIEHMNDSLKNKSLDLVKLEARVSIIEERCKVRDDIIKNIQRKKTNETS
jgi:peptidoglycan hydrolase CwlO-like protein